MSSAVPLKVAILWHMHQPNYCEPFSNRCVLPWVRLHATKDYLDMPLLASRYDRVRVTFNLVPSLLDQIEHYCHGGSDPHLELSRIDADKLTESERRSVLESFFLGPPATMIEPYERFAALYIKARDSFHQQILPRLFTVEELRDLQVWSNLAWVDPMFREQEPARSLFQKGRQYTEDDKQALLSWQIDCMSQIVPTYQRLYEKGRIDVSFTPYYHPILPLLCDTDVAREALPHISLPRVRYRHPEDAETQMKLSQDKFASLFSDKMAGMWPSEGSVSPEVLGLAEKLGVSWMATDEEILQQSWQKAGKTLPHCAQYRVHAFHGVRLFFRDHALSDRVGFVYSGWEPQRAADDFMASLHRIRESCRPFLDSAVVPVVLDGENAWEYFKNDGLEFLNALYSKLDEDPLIQTVTMSDAAATLPAEPLPALFAGSWINHNFRIWIGHDEDNRAWDLLSLARSTVVEYQRTHPQPDRHKLDAAWKQIYIAEGSDWCWWYGDDHRGPNNAEFDAIFRKHLAAVFECLDLPVPDQFRVPIHRKTAATLIVPPENQVTPVIDGSRTHFYEWAGAGSFDCRQAGGAMHRVDRALNTICFAYDNDKIFVRCDMATPLSHEQSGLSARIQLSGDKSIDVRIPLVSDSAGADTGVVFAVRDIVEMAVDRNLIFESGFGKVTLLVQVYDDARLLESWPEHDTLSLTIPEHSREMFWPF